MKRKTVITFVLALTLSVLITLSVGAFAGNSEYRGCGAVRMHIIANSDSEEDQNVKMLIKTRIAETMPDIFQTETKEETVEKISAYKEKIEQTANEVLEENGFSYGAVAVFGYEDYPEREYDGVTYPAGEYLSLRVILGKGEGHNWWCVLFPMLVRPTATTFEKNDGSKTTVKFRFGFSKIFS